MPLLIYKPILYCYIMLGVFAPAKPVMVIRHPLHISTTDISLNTQDSKIEIICTIFTDDFEAALSKQFHNKIDLVKPEMHTAMDALIKNYIITNLQLKPGGHPASLNYLGYEIKDAAANVYLESDKIPVFKKIEASVSLLQNLYPDQMNIVHITVNGTRKSTKLDYPDKVVKQEF